MTDTGPGSLSLSAQHSSPLIHAEGPARAIYVLAEGSYQPKDLTRVDSSRVMAHLNPRTTCTSNPLWPSGRSPAQGSAWPS